MSDLVVLTNKTAIGDNDTARELLIPAGGYIASAVALFLIGFFGFSLNLFVMILMWKDKQLWTPLNVVLFNLVCSDFLVSILGNPWTFISAVFQSWIFGKTLCIFYGFIMSLLGITSITSLTVLAFERYLIIAQPFRKRSLSFRGAKVLIGFIWLYSFTLTAPPLMGWGEYVNEAAGLSCSVNWEQRSYNSTTYIMYLFVFGLFVPLLVIVFSYANIIHRMKKNAFKMGQVTKVEGKVAYIVLIMIIAFLLAWSPYAILALIVQFGDASLVTPGIAVFPAILAKSSICYNPLIYVGLNSQFRQSLKSVQRKNLAISTCETYALGTSRNQFQDTERLTLGNLNNDTDCYDGKQMDGNVTSGKDNHDATDV